MRVELRERSFGELFGQCFSLTAAHFGKLVVIVVLLGLPLAAAFGWLQSATEALEKAAPNSPEQQEALAGLAGAWLLWMALSLILGPVQQGASILAVSGSFTGRELSLGECLRQAIRRVPSLLGFSMMFALLIALGALTLGIMSVVWMATYYVGAPAIMIENVRAGEGLRRSRALTAGWRLRVFGLAVLVAIIVQVLAQSLGAAIRGAGITGVTGVTVTFLVGTIAGIPQMMSSIVYYFQLRVVKEAFDVETLASLVDAIAERGETEAHA